MSSITKHVITFGPHFHNKAPHFPFKGSSYLFTEYKYPVDPGAGHRNRAEYARQYGPVTLLTGNSNFFNIIFFWPGNSNLAVTPSFPVWRGADSRVWVGSPPRPRPRKQVKPKIRRKTSTFLLLIGRRHKATIRRCRGQDDVLERGCFLDQLRGCSG